MINTKLVEVLRCFNKKETKKLYAFLNFPLLSKRKKTLKLLHYLQPYLPTFDNFDQSKAQIYQIICDTDIYDNLDFNRICADAIDLIEHFLRYVHLDKNNIHANQAVFDFYLKHHLYKHFDTLHKTLDEALHKSPLRNEDYLFQKWLLSTYLLIQETRQHDRKESHTLPIIMNNFDDYYTILKLHYINISHTYKTILHYDKNNFLETELIHHLEKNGVENKVPPIQLMYYMYLLGKEGNNDENIAKVAELNSSYSNMLNPIERLNIYMFLQNSYIKKINEGKGVIYEQKLLDLYKEQLAAGMMYESGGYIMPQPFKNIVQISLKLKEYDWTLAFINEYTQKLMPDKQADTHSYCMAIYLFNLQNYQACIKTLQRVEPIDIFFKTDSKRLLIRSYYELGEHESALASLETFKVFVHRNKLINDSYKSSNRNFANMLTQMILTPKVGKLLKLKAKLENLQRIADRKWLMEKINLRIERLLKSEKIDKEWG